MRVKSEYRICRDCRIGVARVRAEGYERWTPSSLKYDDFLYEHEHCNIAEKRREWDTDDFLVPKEGGDDEEGGRDED